MAYIKHRSKPKSIDYETLMPFRSQIPFDLTHRLKPIVQTSPLKKIATPENNEIITKAMREKYRKTKPFVCRIKFVWTIWIPIRMTSILMKFFTNI